MSDEKHSNDDPSERGAALLRSILHRRGLPSGRALLGAVLVTIAVVGLFVSNRRAQADPTTSYVVFAQRVERGQRIQPDDVTTRPMALAEDVAALAERDPTSVIGTIASETMLPGQLAQPQALTVSGSSMPVEDEIFEVSFDIPAARSLGGLVHPGDEVDVVATLGDGSRACTTTIVRAARVVRTAGQGSGGVGREDLVITVAVDDREAVLGTVLAVDEARATIVRSSRASESTLAGSVCVPDVHPGLSSDDTEGGGHD